MERKRKLLLGKTAAILGAIPFLIWAHEYGPDAGYAGVPKENGTCLNSQCHVGTLNPSGGGVTVTFAGGQTYTPGVKQHLVVTISDASTAGRAWGFQLTVRHASNTASTAGSLASTDANTLVMCADPVNLANEQEMDFGASQTCSGTRTMGYIEHSLAGYTSTVRKVGSATYEFDWTPPASDVGNLTVYVAANSGPATASPTQTGADVYTKTYTLTPQAAGAPPSITPSGVVSAGAFGAFASAAPGSWIEIYGANLSATTRGWEGADFSGVNAPTSLDGVKVTVGGKAAFLDYVSPGQVNAQLPSDVATGTQQLTVTNSNGTSAAYNLTVTAAAPGLLAPAAFSVGGKQHVVALHQDGSFVLPPNSIAGLNTRPAKPGETVILYGIGFGAVLTASNGSIAAGEIVQQANTLSDPFQLQIGGQPASVGYDGLAPNFVGLYQFNVTVPVIANNDAAPLTFTLNGAKGAQTLVLAVHD